MTREQHIVWDPSLCIEFDSKNSLTHHFSRREPLMRFINDLQMSFTRIIFQIETQTQRNLITIGTKIRTKKSEQVPRWVKRCPLFKILEILYTVCRILKMESLAHQYIRF